MLPKQTCKAAKVNGEPCPNPARPSGYCFAHDPAAGAQRAEARRRGGQHRHMRHAGDPASVPTHIRSLGDVLALLDYGTAEALAMDNNVGRGRLLVALAGAYVEAIKIGEFETRLAALEQSSQAKA